MIPVVLDLMLQTAPAVPVAQDTPSVVVTAHRLEDTERAWRDCMAAACPPDAEVKTALAHAENQFVAGDYQQARVTLKRTIGHVDRFAKQYPVAVADIWRADARIAAHLGQTAAARIGQFESVDALKAGLAKDDPPILVQRIEVADTFARQGRFDVARMRYFKIAEQAERMKQPRIQGTALLRLAILDTAFAEEEPTIYGDRARASIARIRATTDPQLGAFREAAELIEARQSARSGDMARIDAIANRYHAQPTRRPMLLFAPTYDFDNTPLDPDVGYESLSPSDYADQWLDLSFVIGPDGRVKDTEILRASPKLRDWWTGGVLKSVAGRRYAPVAVPGERDGIRRIERYTLTGAVGRMGVPGGRPRLVMLDMTSEPTPGGKDRGAIAPASVPAN